MRIKKVLINDDSPTECRRFDGNADKAGLSVSTAENADEALSR